MLIEAGANVNAVGNDGRARLHQAAEAGNLVVAAVLLASGADINGTDNNGVPVMLEVFRAGQRSNGAGIP